MKFSKSYKLLLFSFFLPLTIWSQPISGCISYKYILNLSGVPTTQTAYLYFNNNESVFIHSKGKKGNVMKTADGKDWNGETLDKQFGGWYQDTIGAIVFKSLKNNKLSVRQFFFGTPYLVEEPKLPVIKWVITPDKKNIGSFNCQKATTRFRGRNYTVWFTMDIPISNGPWKLQGLPGLILDAADDVGEVNFLFSSIDMPSAKQMDIKTPMNGKKASFDIYKKADDIEFERYKKESESIDVGRGGHITIGRGKVNLIEKEYEQ